MGSSIPPVLATGDDFALSDYKTEAQIFKAFDALSRDYDFAGFLVLSIPVRGAPAAPGSVIMTSWPDGLADCYEAAGPFRSNPVLERLRRSTVPFAFDTRQTRPDGVRSAIDDRLSSSGIARGVYIPVHDAAGGRGAVGFGGHRAAVTPDELNALTFVAGHLFGRLSEIRARSTKPKTALSGRELDCLRLAAAGKTSQEIARRLSISEYTATHYLNRATRKLDSVNRVQTVAKALRAGLIA